MEDLKYWQKQAELQNEQSKFTSGYIQVLPHPGGTCPNCGYCDRCGRGGYVPYTRPYWPPDPIWYQPAYPTWTITSGSTDPGSYGKGVL